MNSSTNISKKNEVIHLILDTSAIIWSWKYLDQGSLKRIFRTDKIFLYTTDKVLGEIKYSSTEVIINTIIEKITVIAPARHLTKQAKQIAGAIGTLSVLSDTDISIIALALDFIKKDSALTVVWTDDLKLQNVCARLGIPFFSMRKRIKYLIIRKKLCLDCKTQYLYHFISCPNCGSTRFKAIIRRIRIKW